MTGTSMDGLDCIYVDININKHYNLKYDILDFNTRCAVFQRNIDVSFK